jgi:hypothetical protein
MRQVLAFVLLGAVFVLPSNTSVSGQGKSRAHSPNPKASTTTHGPKTITTQAGASHAPKAMTARASTAPKAHGAKATTQTAGTSHTSKPAKVKTAPTTTATTTTATTSTTPPPATLPKNPRVVERLRGLLPPGTDMNAAAEGFRNQGQFVAAVHVSNNLGLRFEDLKSRMVTSGMSLGAAIHELRGDVDADLFATNATRQAQKDLGTNGGFTRY